MIAAWKKALGPDSTGPPFAGDLENPVYLNILQTLREFKVDSYPLNEK